MTAPLRRLLSAVHVDPDGRACVYADQLGPAIVATEAEEQRLTQALATASGRGVAQTRWDVLGRAGSGDYAQEVGSSSDRAVSGAESSTSALGVNGQTAERPVRSDR